MCHFIIFDNTIMRMKKNEIIFWSIYAGFYAICKAGIVQHQCINPLVLQFSMSFIFK